MVDLTDSEEESVTTKKKKNVSFHATTNDSQKKTSPISKSKKKSSGKSLRIHITVPKPKKVLRKVAKNTTDESTQQIESPTKVNTVTTNDQKVVESPRRFSPRIKEQQSPIRASSRSTEVIVRANNQIRRVKRRQRDPINHAIGHRKTPKTLTPGEKKYRRQFNEKKQKIDDRVEYYDALHDVDDLKDSSDEETKVDLYEDNPWHFIDKSTLIPQTVSKEDRHDLDVYGPALYNDYELDRDEATTVLENLLTPLIDKAKKKEKKARQAFENIIVKWGETKDKRYLQAYAEYEKAYVERDLLEAELNHQSIFLPHDSIIALQLIPSIFKKGEYEYFALTHHPDKAQGYCKKLISKEWLYDHLDPEFLTKMEKFQETAGWISFGVASKKKRTKQMMTTKMMSTKMMMTTKMMITKMMITKTIQPKKNPTTKMMTMEICQLKRKPKRKPRKKMMINKTSQPKKKPKTKMMITKTSHPKTR